MSTGTAPLDLSAFLGQQMAERRLELPMLPVVAGEVLAAVQQETTDAARLSALIHKDQALAANVLRVANSAAYCGQVPCASLHQAVSRLGMQLITEIAMAVSVKNRVFANPACGDLLARLWRHSVIAGFFTKEIARTRRRNVEIAFLCGLLHDIGKAVSLLSIERHLGSQQVDSTALAQALHEQHMAAGRALAEQWRLPDAIVECLQFHHDYERATRYQEMAMTTCLADLLAHLAVATGDTVAPPADAIRQHPVLAGLNLYPDQLDQLIARSAQALQLAEGMR